VNEHVTILCKKRGQLKKAIVDMVQLCMSWLELLEKDKKLELIATLASVTEGKLFVEVERARIIRTWAAVKEQEGKLDEAANLLQEVQVETFGAMERREKAEYILDQMRIVLLRGDYIRCYIIHKKINPKLLEAADFQDVKLKFHEYMMRYYMHDEDYLQVSKCYHQCFNTPIVQEDSAAWTKALEAYVLYLLLSPFDNEQRDLLNKVNDIEKKKLATMDVFMKLVSEFLTVEIMAWPLPYEAHLRCHAVFSDAPHPGGAARWKLLYKRVMQHNIQVMSSYYDQISIRRLSAVLRITDVEAEEEILELVTSKFLSAKIDRPAGIIRFGDRREVCDTLNDWSGDIAKLLDLAEESCHLIAKERMVHAARKATGKVAL